MPTAMDHGAAEAAMRLDSEEAGESLPLELDITTQKLSLAGIEKELEAYADSDVLRAILDQGAGGGRRELALPQLT